MGGLGEVMVKGMIAIADPHNLAVNVRYVLYCSFMIDMLNLEFVIFKLSLFKFGQFMVRFIFILGHNLWNYCRSIF